MGKVLDYLAYPHHKLDLSTVINVICIRDHGGTGCISCGIVMWVAAGGLLEKICALFVM